MKTAVDPTTGTIPVVDLVPLCRRTRYFIETASVSSIWWPRIFGDDFGLLFGGKNAGRILKLLVVREIEVSEHVETAPRLR